MHVVIVGNGVAGIEAARVVRAREPRWNITVVSEESEHFFSRPALLYALSGQLSRRDLEPYERDLYRREGLRRVRARAAGVDVAQHRLHLLGELPHLQYDRLLLACGSRPRQAPFDGASLRGVGHFVTLQDLDWLEAELHGASRDPTRPDATLVHAATGSPYVTRAVARLTRRDAAPRGAAVIGGGLVGVECAEAIAHAGVPARFFVRDEWFWASALDAREAAFVSAALSGRGITVHTQAEIAALEGDSNGNVCTVRTRDDERFDAELVVVAIGVAPNTEWLGASGVPRDATTGGILVDETLATAAPDVFAAGDCAAVPSGAEHAVEQLWYTARAQGRVAGESLVGRSTRYTRGLRYDATKLVDLEHTVVGSVAPSARDVDTWFFEEQGAVRSTTRIVSRAGHVVGFSLLGRRWNHEVLMRWIEERRALHEVVPQLASASFDAELVPPLSLPESALRAAGVGARADAPSRGAP